MKYIKSIILLAFLAIPSFAGENVIGPFSGLNNADNAATLPPDKAQDLLNVDLSLGGRSVKKREGYGLAYALTNTTSPIHGSYEFYDGNGNDITLAFNDTYMTSTVNGVSPTVLFSTGPNGVTYQCTDSQGFAYCANTSRNNIIKTNGATYSLLAPASTGTMVAVTPDRIVHAGFSSAPNRVDFSAAADFTSWTPGINPNSAFNFTITAPGSRITHICYAFNRVMWFKDSSFGYIIQGTTLSNWLVQTVSPNVGTLDNSSVYYQGILYFRGNDAHIWSYDGANLSKLTRDITATISASQNRTSNSWIQTTQTDFQAGATSPAGWIDTSTASGMLFLSTATPVDSFVDTVSTDFSAGTLTNVSTAIVSNAIRLSFQTPNVIASFYPGADNQMCTSECSGSYYQSRIIGASSVQNSFLSHIVMRLKKNGSPGSFNVNFMRGNASNPIDTLEQVSLPASSVSSSVGDVVVNFSSTTKLSAGTTYWIQLIPTGSCDASNNIDWYGTSGVGGSGSLCASSIVQVSYAFKLFTTTFSTSGNLISRAFDVGFTTASWIWGWSNSTCGLTQPSNTATTLQTQTSSSTTGTWESLSNVNCGEAPTSTVQEFIRYKVTFTTTDNSTSPVLSDLTLAMTSRLRPNATFYSQIKNAANLTAWDTFNGGISGTGNLGMSIRASTNTFSILSSTPTWKKINNNGDIPSVSTGAFFQIALNPNVNLYTQNPVLTDFTQNWFEGQALDKAYGTYFKDAIWWAVASGTAATTNNRILRLDLLNQTWLLYDIPVNGFYTSQNRLYLGSALGGNVFKFGSSNSDNGTAINAYWKSKDFFGESPFTDSDITTLSTFFAAVNSSTMTLTYTLVGSSSTSYNIPLQRNNAAFGIFNRNMPQGTIGNTFNVKFGNNAAEQPFEVFAINYGSVEKPWKPGAQ